MHHRSAFKAGLAAGMVLAAWLARGAPALAAITVDATVTPQSAQVGEPLRLSITITGAQQVQAPALVNIDAFEAGYVGPSTQISVINGRVDARVQHIYSLVPKKEGHFVLGPFTVEHQGKRYETAALPVDIVAAGPVPDPPGRIPGAPAPAGQAAPGGGRGAPSPGDTPRGLRLVLSVPRQEVYLHERLPLDVTLYVPPIRVGDVQYPTVATDGLSLDKFPEPTQRQEVIDQKPYKVLHFQTTIIPLRAGDIALGPATLRLHVYRDSVRRDDPFFPRFFQDVFAVQQPVDVTSDPVALTVLPLPEAGQPPGFSGAVGAFKLDVKASPTQAVAGDPVTVSMAVTGSGNLADAAPPALEHTTAFRAYEPYVTASSGGGSSLAVSKSFEQVVIPSDASVTAVPPVRFSYFDPQARRYQTLESEPIALAVRPPAEAPAREIISGGAGRRPTAEERLGRDIVFIKDDPGRLTPRSASRLAGPALVAWPLAPPLLYAATVWFDRRRRRLRGDIRYARFTRAAREAHRALAAVRHAVSRGDRDAFYDGVSRTMQEYLAAKLDLPPGAIDVDAVMRSGVSETSVAHLRDFFTTCERVRFAPGSVDGDMRGTLELAQEIIRALEREPRLRRVQPTRGG